MLRLVQWLKLSYTIMQINNLLLDYVKWIILFQIRNTMAKLIVYVMCGLLVITLIEAFTVKHTCHGDPVSGPLTYDD